jgi:hypothetical protein
MEQTLNSEKLKVKMAIKNKLPTEHNYALETYYKSLMEATK